MLRVATAKPQRERSPDRRPLRGRSERRAPVRLLRFGFLLLLVTAVAQVLWWELDQTHYARGVEEQRLRSFEADAAAARELLRRGAGAREIEASWPHLEVGASGADTAVVVRAEAKEAVREERRRHLNQYRWEGAFFLLVLLAGIALVWRVLRQEAELRRRQQNFIAAVTHELKSPIASLQLADRDDRAAAAPSRGGLERWSSACAATSAGSRTWSADPRRRDPAREPGGRTCARSGCRSSPLVAACRRGVRRACRRARDVRISQSVPRKSRSTPIRRRREHGAAQPDRERAARRPMAAAR